MKINWKVRLKNPTWWFCIVASIVMPIITYFGLELKSFTTWDIVFDTLINAISNPYVVFTALFSLFNAVVDPTTKGLSDSFQALNYSLPEKSYKSKNNFSSEALKKGLKPQKSIEVMSIDEIKEFKGLLDCNCMGFDGKEGESNGNKTKDN